MTLDTIGKYRVLREIGRGGMGVVLHARDADGGRDVAIKALHPHLAEDPVVASRFESEAATMRSLRHPSIVAVLPPDENATGSFFVMEYVGEKNLRHLLDERGAFPVDEAVRALAAIAAALDYAHDVGVVHRDVKPENVMTTPEGAPKVGDFGVARHIEGTAHTQQAPGDLPIGTSAYVAPERWKGADADPLSDQYSLGVLAYELFTGRRPFAGDSGDTLGYAHVHEPVPEARLAPGTPPETARRVNAALARALAKEPAARFPSARAFAEDLVPPASTSRRPSTASAPGAPQPSSPSPWPPPSSPWDSPPSGSPRPARPSFRRPSRPPSKGRPPAWRSGSARGSA